VDFLFFKTKNIFLIFFNDQNNIEQNLGVKKIGFIIAFNILLITKIFQPVWFTSHRTFLALSTTHRRTIMAYPQRKAMQMNDEGEDFMSHKPTDTSDTKKPDRTRTVSAIPPINKEKSRNSNATNTGGLDKRLRAAEASLQQNGMDANKSAQDVDIGLGVGNVDKIRDILFGGQMRDYDKRFKRLEERFNQENMHFRDDMFQRLKVLEERIEGELDSLTEKGKIDRQERQSALQDFEHELKVLKNDMSNRHTQLDEQISKDIKNLRQQTHNKFQELALQLRQQNDSLTTLINQEVVQLQEEKVNRSDLASFFNEFAVRLTRNFENPDEIE
jgi:hypothetical protein